MQSASWNHTVFGRIIPAGQTAAPVVPATATTTPATVAPFCPSLPSSNSALQVARGEPGGWLGVARDVVLRGGLIWLGMSAYDWSVDRRDPHRVAHAFWGSVGIEVFVLGWTKYQVSRSGG